MYVPGGTFVYVAVIEELGAGSVKPVGEEVIVYELAYVIAGHVTVILESVFVAVGAGVAKTYIVAEFTVADLKLLVFEATNVKLQEPTALPVLL